MKLSIKNKHHLKQIKKLIMMELSDISHDSQGKLYTEDSLKTIIYQLSLCQIQFETRENQPHPDEIYSHMPRENLIITIQAPLDPFRQLESSAESVIEKAAHLVFRRYVKENEYYDMIIDIVLHSEWLKELEPAADNQNLFGGKIEYRKMTFNSPGEVAIAKELDRRKILYMANCPMSVGAPDNRELVFPDFLIFYEGRWGIFEVSGRTYHTDTVRDSQRDRKILQHINIQIQHFDSMDCKDNPGEQVDEFLRILKTK